MFSTRYTQRVKDVVQGFRKDDIESALVLKETLFQNHPYQAGQREHQFVTDLLARPELRKYLNWN